MIEICQNSQIHLSGLIDGQIKEPLLSDVKTHLQHCADCSSQLRKITAFTNNLQSGLKTLYRQNILAEVDLWQKLQSKLQTGCELITNDFSSYIDHQLPIANQEALEGHWGNCATCSKQFRQFQVLTDFASKAIRQNQHVAENFWRKIKERLQTDCKLIQEEIPAIADQEISETRHKDINEHLTKCVHCAQFSSGQANIVELLKNSYKPKFAQAISLIPGVRARLHVVAFRRVIPGAVKPLELKRKLIAGGYALLFTLVLLFPLYIFGSRIENKPTEEILFSNACEEPAQNVETYVYAH